VLESVHPGEDPRRVGAETGWGMTIEPHVPETSPPTPDELRIVRECDPLGVWTR
jgi:glutaconate CoA-transferase, subunit B